MGSANSTVCEVENKPRNNATLIEDGDLHLQLHQIGFIVAGACALIATIISVWLIYMHLSFYTNRKQQRHVVRILALVPIYAWSSWASFYWWTDATYIVLARDCYEAVVIGSFFFLLISYLGDTPDDVRRLCRGVELKKWIWPFGFVRYRPSGVYFLQLMKWGCLQYVVLRPASTIVAVATEATGYYCLPSWSPAWAHVWTSTTVAISVTFGMYAVLQLYVTLRTELAPYSPMLKFLSVKAIVFVLFWQDTFLSGLEMLNVIKETPYFTADQVAIGISSLASCVEMVAFACLHIKAFSFKPYRPKPDPETHKRTRTAILPALWHCCNLRDFGREIRDGGQYMVAKAKGLEPDIDRRHDFMHAHGRVRAEPKVDASRDHRDPVDLEGDLRKIIERTSSTPFVSRRAEADGSPERPLRYDSLPPSRDLHFEPTAYVPILERETVPPPSTHTLHGRKEQRWWTSIRRTLSGHGYRPALGEMASGYDDGADTDASPILSPRPMSQWTDPPSVGQHTPSLAFVPDAGRPLSSQLGRPSSGPPRPVAVVMPKPLSPLRYPSLAPSPMAQRVTSAGQRQLFDSPRPIDYPAPPMSERSMRASFMSPPRQASSNAFRLELY